jgi:N-acetylglucosamine kinase-like BadF-type ATPase
MSFRIGVDGGASKTECILVDARGTVAARHTGPGCNPSLVGQERARRILQDALQMLVAGRASLVVDRLLLCMAGSRSFWNDTAAALRGFGRVEATPDSLPVLELATGGAPGLVLHAGTGSFVAARAPDGAIHYAGGLGWRFGDGGSGYDLGRRAIAHALLELQGWTPRTVLADELIKHTGLADYTANSRFFHTAAEANAQIAAFAPRIVDLAEHGNGPAQQIIAESLADLGRLVSGVLQRFFALTAVDSPVPCGISGALLNRHPCLNAVRALAATHAWPVHLEPVTAPPIEGVRRLLMKMA